MGGTEGFLARKAADSGVGIMCGFWFLLSFGSCALPTYVIITPVSVLRRMSRAGSLMY